MPPTKVHVGERYGRWLVISEADGPKRFECLCDPSVGGCGDRKDVLAVSLIQGQSQSCGCSGHELELQVEVSKPSRFEDERGLICDLEVGPIDAVTRISTTKGSVRGNHYHNDTWQATLLLSGCLKIVTETESNQREFFLNPGEMVISPPGEKHAWQAEKDSECLVLTRGPRSGANYESDTFRLETPLL